MITVAIVLLFAGFVYGQRKFEFVLFYETECTIEKEANEPYNCSGKAQSNDIKTLINGAGDVEATITKLTGSVSSWSLTGIKEGNV